MTNMINSEIMLRMMPNQTNHASKACHKIQNLKLAKGLKPRLHVTSPKGPRGPKIVPRKA